MLDFVDFILSKRSIFSQMLSSFLKGSSAEIYTMQRIKPPSKGRDMSP